MRRDDKFRFSLGWSRDTAEKIAVGDLLERLKNRKSDLVVQAVWEYIGNHPEVMTEDAKIVISVHSTPTDEQTFAKIQSMIDASRKMPAGQARKIWMICSKIWIYSICENSPHSIP